MRVGIAAIVATIFLLLSQTANAGGPCCDQCGDDMVCKLVKTTKKIKVICYGCECDTVCIPGPSSKCTEHCETICKGGKNCSDKCTCGKSPVCTLKWTEWIPGCAKP